LFLIGGTGEMGRQQWRLAIVWLKAPKDKFSLTSPAEKTSHEDYAKCHGFGASPAENA